MTDSAAVEEIEVSIESFRANVDMLDALERLGSNPDFIKVIDKGYFRDKASQLVLTKADPEMQTEDMQKSIVRSIDAISELRQHFRFITQFGRTAKRSIEVAEGELELELASAGEDV